jgi:hypothetical protein
MAVGDLDKERWGRKIFKIYKTLKKAEKKSIGQYNSEQTLLSRKLFKVVVVLFNLQRGLSPRSVRETLKLDQVAEKTNEICGESNRGDNASNY